MEKLLVNSSHDIIKLFLDKYDLDYSEIEELLGIEFAFESGRYMSDAMYLGNYDLIEELDQEEVDESTWRIVEDGGLPESYPCLMVYHIDDAFDRFGDTSFRLFEYVYPKDFNLC